MKFVEKRCEKVFTKDLKKDIMSGKYNFLDQIPKLEEVKKIFTKTVELMEKR